MSEIIEQGEWAAPEIMQHWREIVARRASLTMGGDGGPPKAKFAMEHRFPEASARALYLLSETDMSKNAIARTCGFAKIQLDRLAVANAPTLEHKRPELAKKFTEIAGKAADAMGRKLERILDNEELLDATPINHLAIAMGISIDKAGGLSSISTSSTELKIGLSLDDAVKMIEAAKAKVADKLRGEALEAEVIP